MLYHNNIQIPEEAAHSVAPGTFLVLECATKIYFWLARGVDFLPAGKSKLKAAARSTARQNGLLVESVSMIFC